MEILKQLKAIIEKEGLNESAKQFYLREISELDKEKQQEIINLVGKMENAGFKNNFSNAFSEVTENIPQFARMTVFKELHKISRDIDANCDYAEGNPRAEEDDLNWVLLETKEDGSHNERVIQGFWENDFEEDDFDWEREDD